MKRLISILFLMILTLSGCAVKEIPARECVTDTLDPPSAPDFYMTAELPAEARLEDSCEEGRFAVFSDGSYEIYKEIFPAASAEAGLLAVTGKTADQLEPIPVSSFPQPEYRFAWTATGEEGPLSCTGTLIYDGKYCYALTIRCPPAREKNCREVFMDILNHVTLNEV